jgi:DNA-binding LacI/PurR family transcriptional regulator
MEEFDEVQKAIRLRRRMGEIAEAAGVSKSFVSAVYRGRKTASPKLLDVLGLERVVSYRPKPKERDNG